ncbi:zinc-binding dehydrogenase [uncultured Microbacterium sp.]|uniref:zinc-dependent alcohol dehydrogenase n=1 Tax=uncultured Microbacterium sp. TaxID=191216 RepID=UPI0035C99C66
MAIPELQPNEALVAVEWVGLCGSDAEEYLEGPVVITPPVTLGHEIVGVVATAAADGSGPPVGVPVVVDVVTGCGHCYWCQRHEEGLCPDLSVTGQHVDGGLAEFVVARAERLVPIPDGLDIRAAALAEPLSVAVRAVRKVGAMQGTGVVVIGGGTVGMLTAQVARSAGASPVTIVEPDPARRALAGRWGIASVWAEDAPGRAAQLAPMFPPRGVDVVFECSGRPGMSAEAIELVRRGGTTLLLGVLPAREPIDTIDIVLGEKTVRGSAAHMWDDDVAVAVSLLAAGAVDVEPMITHSYPLDDVADAFDTLVTPGRGAMKILVGVAAATARAASKESG